MSWVFFLALNLTIRQKVSKAHCKSNLLGNKKDDKFSAPQLTFWLHTYQI